MTWFVFEPRTGKTLSTLPGWLPRFVVEWLVPAQLDYVREAAA